MKRLTWAKITSGIALCYGMFLILQTFVSVWTTETAHKIAMFTGGVFLILWAFYFWKRTDEKR